MLRKVSEETVSEIQKTGFLMESLILIEIVYYTFRLFQMCHPDPTSAKAYLESEYDPDSNEFSAKVMHPATARVIRGARKKGHHLGYSDAEIVAREMLLKVMRSEDSVVSVGYEEVGSIAE